MFNCTMYIGALRASDASLINQFEAFHLLVRPGISSVEQRCQRIRNRRLTDISKLQLAISRRARQVFLRI